MRGFMLIDGERSQEPWARRHNSAVAGARSKCSSGSIVHMLDAVSYYMQEHRNMYDSPIGDDYVLGPAVADILRGALVLLNGETGHLDCGTLDKAIRDLAADHNLDIG